MSIKGLVNELVGRRIDNPMTGGGADQWATGTVRFGGQSWSAQWNFTRTLESVYGNPTGRACVETIASDFQRPPWQIKDQGSDEPVENHPLLPVLNQPNPTMSGTALQYHISRDMDLAGAFFGLKLRGADFYGDGGPLTGLRRLPPQRVTVISDEDDELVGFIYIDRMGKRIGLLPEQVVYVHHPHPDRVSDRLAPAVTAGLSGDTDLAAMRFNYDLLANDSALPGYMSVEGLTPKTFQEWVGAWQQGSEPGKTRFIGGQGKATYVKVGQSNQELTYRDLRDASREDIFRSFLVPRVLIDPTDATFSNMGVARTFYVVSRIAPKWTLVGDELTFQLRGEFDGDWQVGFDLSSIDELHEGTDALVQRGTALLQLDVMTINELRDDLGWDPVPWGDIPFGELRSTYSAPPLSADTTTERQFAPWMIRAIDAVESEMKALEGPKVITSKSVTIDSDALRSRHESRAERSMRRFFDRQKTAVVARLRSRKGKNLKSADDFWDENRWMTELGDEAHVWLAAALEEMGEKVTGTLIRDVAFDPQTEVISNWLTQRSGDLAGLVNGTTADDVRAVLADVQAQGASIDEMATAIEAYFDDQSQYRAEMVARTEITGATNFATLEAARQSGVVEGKTWLAASDAELECAGLDGTTVGLDESFGDVDQPPLHPNCRCTVTLTLKEQP